MKNDHQIEIMTTSMTTKRSKYEHDEENTGRLRAQKRLNSGMTNEVAVEMTK